MSNSFFGLNIATKGLYVAQKNLDVINHNVSNTNTPGYSRQEAVIKASVAMPTGDGSGMLGQGSLVTSVKRIRDEYLDVKFWNENTVSGYWTSKSSILNEVEMAYNEPSDSGFNTVTNEFYQSLQDLSKNPKDLASRSVVKGKAETFCKYFNDTATRLENMQSDLNSRVEAKVTELNSLANQTAQLNKQIYYSETTGYAANDLRDQRTVLVDKMTKIANVQVSEVSSGSFVNGIEQKKMSITINGRLLVQHDRTMDVEVAIRTTALNEDEDIPNLYDVKAGDGSILTLKGGELKALIDIRDGNEALNDSPNIKGIPYLMRKLNQFVQTFTKAFNEGYIDKNGDGTITLDEISGGHANAFGIDKDGEGSNVAPSGIRFFTYSNSTVGSPLDTNSFLRGKVTGVNSVVSYTIPAAKTLNITVDGNQVAVPLTAAIYPDMPSLSAGIQTDINTALGLILVTSSVTVAPMGDKLTIKSNTSGPASTVTIDAKLSSGAALLGLDKLTEDNGYSSMKAKNISISLEIMSDLNNIAASDKLDESENNNALKQMIDMRQNIQMFSEGAPEDFMKSLIASLGVESQSALRMADNKGTMMNMLKNKRLSDSGVSSDEEMSNMVKFQQAYSASAKMISVMSEIYDVLVNKVGA